MKRNHRRTARKKHYKRPTGTTAQSSTATSSKTFHTPSLTHSTSDNNLGGAAAADKPSASTTINTTPSSTHTNESKERLLVLPTHNDLAADGDEELLPASEDMLLFETNANDTALNPASLITSSHIVSTQSLCNQMSARSFISLPSGREPIAAASAAIV
jgi:hypothetical protein